MKHLNQQMVAADIRRPHLQRYKTMLREALRYPALSIQERDRILRELQQAGKPRDYSQLRLGFVNPGPLSSGLSVIELSEKSLESLASFSHVELYQAAHQAGLAVSPSDTKAQIIKAISQHQGESQ